MTDQLFTKTDCKIIQAQIERRTKYRTEFLKARTDPSKHAAEAGYVFDIAVQRYMSMKATAAEYFPANTRTITAGALALGPMFLYAYLIQTSRAERERQIRCGTIPYRQRIHKLQ